MAQKFLWQMIKEAVENANGAVMTNADIKHYISTHYGEANPSSVNCTILACCVNKDCRINWPENSKPRKSNSQYDFLFSVGRGKVVLYDPAIHGEWAIDKNSSGSLFVRCLSGNHDNLPIAEENQVSALSIAAKKQKINHTIVSPCVDEVELYLAKWDSLENYTLQESALNKLFFSTYPYNTNIDDILIKVSALNDFYSTNIFSVFTIAKHIFNMNIDERLSNGDDTLVNEIALVEMENGNTRNFYSFATKYCSHHRPYDYAIYDSYVDKILRYFRDKDGFSKFQNYDIKSFPIFKSILLQFREFYHLQSYSLKDIDRYLWQLGKDKFPINYNRK